MSKLKIVTPEGVIYEDDRVNMVVIPTTDGDIGVKDNHVPLISIVRPGEILIKKDENIVELAVSRGIVQVRENSEVYILADTAERAENIDIERAEEARKRAEEFIKQKQDIADVEFARLQAKIEKELARIRLARKYKR